MIKLVYHRLLALCAFLGFILYVGWNMFYVSKGNIPPSILYKLTGIPSPTTGMYRSFIGIVQMDYRVYITNNPFVIPFIILLLYTIVIIATKYKNEQPLRISNSMGLSYMLVFAISEIWMLIK